MVIKREVVMNKKNTGCIKLGQNDANDLLKLIAFLKENSPSLQFWGETDEVWSQPWRLRLIAHIDPWKETSSKIEIRVWKEFEP